jgi:hypothetical protein
MPFDETNGLGVDFGIKEDVSASEVLSILPRLPLRVNFTALALLLFLHRD